MQAPTGYQQMNASTPAFPEQEHLKCPRCDSDNTKFCYYNNYNLSQPRHFCKNCRRYWTKGGSLRNIPVGGVTRKTTAKRSSSSSSTTTTKNNNPKRQTPNQNIPDPSPPPPPKPTSSSSTFRQQSVLNSNSSIDPTRMYPLPVVDHQDMKMMDIGGNSFSALLASRGQFGNVLEGLSSNGSGLKPVQANFEGNLDSGRDPELGESSNNNESYWSNDWPDLSIYAPSSSFRR